MQVDRVVVVVVVIVLQKITAPSFLPPSLPNKLTQGRKRMPMHKHTHTHTHSNTLGKTNDKAAAAAAAANSRKLFLRAFEDQRPQPFSETSDICQAR